MPRKRSYHHGNLKESLYEAALAVIAESGPAGFTLREAARRAGVSHNAPYRHFRDKDELLAAVAAQGFDRLTRVMTQAARGGTDQLERLLLAGRSYIEFALRWPPHFTVMFDADFEKETNPEYAAAGERAFQTLVELIRQCQAAGKLPEGDPEQRALVSWSLVHGIAKLAVAGKLPFAKRTEVLRFYDFAAGALGPTENER